jgi:hypothetical protein
MGKILGANGETLTNVDVDKEVLKGNKTIDTKEIDEKYAVLDAKQAEVNARELMTSKDMKFTPNGSMIIARGFIKPEGTGLISLDSKDSIVPCMEVMKKGPHCRTAKEGQFITIKDQSAAVVVTCAFPYKGELFYFLQEHDIMFFYDEQPNLEDVLASGTTIVRDLTEYVKIDKMKKVKAKITEVDS